MPKYEHVEHGEHAEHGGIFGRSLGRLVGRAAPAVMRNIETEALVESLDVDAIVDALDVDALIARVDVNRIADRLDLDLLVSRLDVNAIADRLDLDLLVSRLDVNAIADRLDLDALVDRLDVNRIADRLDLDALLSEMELIPLMSRGTQEMALSTLDLARRQLVRLDGAGSAVVDRVLGRSGADAVLGPAAALQSDAPIPEGLPTRRDVSGHFAGPFSRLVSHALDASASVALFGLAGAVLGFFYDAITRDERQLTIAPWLGWTLFAIWVFLWFWLPLAATGRSPAKALVGLRVLRGDGTRIGPWRALVRVLCLPWSMALLGLGLFGIVLGRRRRAMHDVIADTVVVYDWGTRRAEQPVPLRARLAARRSAEESVAAASTT